jgi:hypothetical protein
VATTIINRSTFNVVHKKLENTEWVSSLLTCINKYDSGFFTEWYLSMLFQSDYSDSQFSIYDAYGLTCLHSEIGNGNIFYASIYLGETPSHDKRIQDINRKLKKLWHPFRGIFWGGTQFEDGVIFVDNPIELSVMTYEGTEVSGYVSGRFPLEVGTTSIAKTMHYLNSGAKKLARWPYNSDYIYLLASRT